MIVKGPDDRQAELEELQTLKSGDHSYRTKDRIQKQIDDMIVGLAGEKDCAFHLDSAFASCPDHMVIHDLVIVHDGISVQIDHVVFTNKRQVFVIETKSITGTLRIDSDGACSAIYTSGKKFKMASPIEQVQRHATVLKNFLGSTQSSMREIIPIVAISPKTTVKNESQNHNVEILTTDKLPSYIINKQTINNDRFVIVKTDKASSEEVAGAAWLLSRRHAPQKRDWHRTLGISPNEKSKQHVFFDALPVQKRENSIKTAEKIQQAKNAEGAASAEIKILDIHQGKIRAYLHKDGTKISLQWEAGKNQPRFHDECKAHKGAYNPKGYWTLPLDIGRQVVQNLKKPPAKQTDLFEPIDITIENLAQNERTKGEVYVQEIITPYGKVKIYEYENKYSRIPCNNLNDNLVAHVRAICSGRAQKDIDLNEWVIARQHVADIINSLKHPAVRIAS